MQSIIAISGDLGSGKSTVGKLLAEKLHYEYYSSGQFFRSLALTNDLSVLELNKLCTKSTTIDKLVDAELVKLSNKHNIVVDARLAWHFIPVAYKVHLTVLLRIAATRIVNSGRGSVEEYNDIECAKIALEDRRCLEVTRYKKQYNIDIERCDQYDLVISTNNLTPAKVCKNICNNFQKYRHTINE